MKSTEIVAKEPIRNLLIKKEKFENLKNLALNK